MHELSVCQQLIAQVRATAHANGATSVGRITVRLGPLSGVEPDLLEHAFVFARAGELTSDAELVLESAPVVIRCRSCGAEHETASNRLVCAGCGDYHVDLVGGDELLLARIELHGVDPAENSERAESESRTGEPSNV
jgi:hydrogenase nickel incorporation protein HypA/HybF